MDKWYLVNIWPCFAKFNEASLFCTGCGYIACIAICNWIRDAWCGTGTRVLVAMLLKVNKICHDTYSSRYSTRVLLKQYTCARTGRMSSWWMRMIASISGTRCCCFQPVVKQSKSATLRWEHFAGPANHTYIHTSTGTDTTHKQTGPLRHAANSQAL